MSDPAPLRAPAGNVVCDLDGVVYLGQTGIPGAGEALAALEGRGYRLIFATNAPIRTAAQVAEHIGAVSGYPARAEQVITAAMAAMPSAAAASLQVSAINSHSRASSGLTFGFSAD